MSLKPQLNIDSRQFFTFLKNFGDDGNNGLNIIKTTI